VKGLRCNERGRTQKKSPARQRAEARPSCGKGAGPHPATEYFPLHRAGHELKTAALAPRAAQTSWQVQGLQAGTPGGSAGGGPSRAYFSPLVKINPPKSGSQWPIAPPWGRSTRLVDESSSTSARIAVPGRITFTFEAVEVDALGALAPTHRGRPSRIRRRAGPQRPARWCRRSDPAWSSSTEGTGCAVEPWSLGPKPGLQRPSSMAAASPSSAVAAAKQRSAALGRRSPIPPQFRPRPSPAGRFSDRLFRPASSGRSVPGRSARRPRLGLWSHPPLRRGHGRPR